MSIITYSDIQLVRENGWAIRCSLRQKEACHCLQLTAAARNSERIVELFDILKEHLSRFTLELDAMPYPSPFLAQVLFNIRESQRPLKADVSVQEEEQVEVIREEDFISQSVHYAVLEADLKPDDFIQTITQRTQQYDQQQLHS